MLHPLRMMLNASTEEERITALLHDVIEDTSIPLEELSEHGFNEYVIEALRCLTRLSSISYENYIEKVANNSLARKVKLLDLTDNMDIYRIKNPQTYDHTRMEKYQKAYDYLNRIENRERE